MRQVRRRAGRLRSVPAAVPAGLGLALAGALVALWTTSSPAQRARAPEGPAKRAERSVVAKGTGAGSCVGDRLRITAPGGAVGGGMSGFTDAIDFHNSSTVSCVLEGWPGVGVIGPNGHRLQVRVVYATANGAWLVLPTRIVLEPGKEATAWVIFGGGPVGSSSCDTSWSWVVTPPGSRRSTVVPEASQPGGLEPCGGGITLEVSPVHPPSLHPVGSYPSSATNPAAGPKRYCPEKERVSELVCREPWVIVSGGAGGRG